MDNSNLVAPPGRFEHPAVDLEGLDPEAKSATAAHVCACVLAHGDKCRDNCRNPGLALCLGALLALLCASLTACRTEDKPLIGYVSPGLSDGCVASIHEANEWYAERLGFAPLELREVDVEPASAEYREVVFRSRELEGCIGHATWDSDRAGRVHHGTIDLRGECTLRTVVHEMGHVFGLPHALDKENIMYGRSGGMVFTEAQWERIYAALAEL
jgi:hypothetical protein